MVYLVVKESDRTESVAAPGPIRGVKPQESVLADGSEDGSKIDQPCCWVDAVSRVCFGADRLDSHTQSLSFCEENVAERPLRVDQRQLEAVIADVMAGGQVEASFQDVRDLDDARLERMVRNHTLEPVVQTIGGPFSSK